MVRDYAFFIGSAAITAIFSVLAVYFGAEAPLWKWVAVIGGFAFGVCAGVLLIDLVKPETEKLLSFTLGSGLGIACAAGILITLSPGSDSYILYKVEPEKRDTNGQFAIWVGGGPLQSIIFKNVVPWWSPASAKGESSNPNGPYWSIGAALKVPMSELHGGPYLYGRLIPLGDYRIETIGESDGKGIGFVEILSIREFEGKPIQLIDVWKDQDKGDRKLVYSNVSERPTSLRLHLTP